MTRDDIIRMAREAAVINCDCCLPFWPEEDQVNWEIFFERFANLVAAAEREACAKVCDEFADDLAKEQDWHALVAAESCAEEIRARGQS